MPIDRIVQMHDCGVFRDFTWPEDLPDFSRYNLVYGWNGSGKTTLSRIFRALESRAAPPCGETTIRVEGHNVSNDDFPQVLLNVRVFNRDFIAESVFPTTGAGVAPIFVLGKENVDKQKHVDQCKKALADKQSTLAAARVRRSDTERTLGTFCTDKGGVIRDLLRSSGTNPYNNYDKRNFERRAEDMLGACDKDAHLLSDSGRDAFLDQLRGSPKSKLQPISYVLPDLKNIRKNVADLLARTVVTSAIQALKDDSKLSAWVYTGLELHHERAAKTCLFCNQPMPQERLASLGAHFSSQHEELMRSLAAEIASIETAIDTGNGLVIPTQAELHNDLRWEFDAAAAGMRGERDSVVRMLHALLKALEDKTTRVFESVSLSVSPHDLKVDVVANLNDVIRKHNHACDDFQSRITEARKMLEGDSVAASLGQYSAFKDAAQAANVAVTNLESECRQLMDDIGTLERDIVQHSRPAEELNKDLRNYLGHEELRLEVKETGYTIMRYDSAAESLSEGEMTAVALLYFLKSLQDRRFDLSTGVVVLDDPVSSLDANALFFAFGFIRERTQTAHQLIILTHNFTFFRQMRNWFHHLKGQKKKRIEERPAHFYMLDCKHEENRRCSEIRLLDPLLEQFDSEYHYLFARIYRAANAVPHAQLEQSYVLPNLARRMLESFLAFRQPQISGELWEKLKLVQFDETKKIRIIRFLHTHSHSSSLGEPEHDLSLLSEAQAILKDLLDLVQSQDESHYSAMVSLVAPADSTEEKGENGPV